MGAPNYARNPQTYNSGRVYVFLVKGSRGSNWFSQEPDSIITAEQERSNARFGSSVACLGQTDGEASQKVMVGAPYYEEKGAVFVFRYNKHNKHNILELSQTIKSQGEARSQRAVSLIRNRRAASTPQLCFMQLLIFFLDFICQ